MTVCNTHVMESVPAGERERRKRAAAVLFETYRARFTLWLSRHGFVHNRRRSFWGAAATAPKRSHSHTHCARRAHPRRTQAHAPDHKEHVCSVRERVGSVGVSEHGAAEHEGHPRRVDVHGARHRRLHVRDAAARCGQSERELARAVDRVHHHRLRRRPCKHRPLSQVSVLLRLCVCFCPSVSLSACACLMR